jgi:hypothetical protein
LPPIGVLLVTAIGIRTRQNAEFGVNFQLFNLGAAMFEAEVEMERRSSFLPLLLMMCLVASIIGLAGYIFQQAREKTPLMAQDAFGIATAALRATGPATIQFRTGLLKSSKKPEDPNYRLLEKAGIVTVAKAPRQSAMVSITPKGESLIDGIPGFKKTKQADGTLLYEAPLAERQLVGIGNINKNGINQVVVEYRWKWAPNSLGDVFDAGGPLVKSFNLWERQTLINKYEVNFYHGDAATSTLALVRNGREWKIATQ